MKAVVEQNLTHPDLAQRYPAYLNAITSALQQITWQDLQAATGIEPESFMRAAKVLAGARRVIILAGQLLLRSEHGYSGCVTLLDLLLLIGKLDGPGCGFAPLAEENNDQGAVEMGTVTEFLPGARPLASGPDREKIAKQWKGDLPTGRGASLLEMLDRAKRGISSRRCSSSERIQLKVSRRRYRPDDHCATSISWCARNCF